MLIPCFCVLQKVSKANMALIRFISKSATKHPLVWIYPQRLWVILALNLLLNRNSCSAAWPNALCILRALWYECVSCPRLNLPVPAQIHVLEMYTTVAARMPKEPLDRDNFFLVKSVDKREFFCCFLRKFKNIFGKHPRCLGWVTFLKEMY